MRISTCMSGLFLSTAALTLAAMPAVSLPVGGTISGGKASLASSATSLSVMQSSPRAVIDWRGFDIGAGERVEHVHVPGIHETVAPQSRGRDRADEIEF